MKQAYLAIRSTVLWVVSALHFFPGGVLLLLLALFFDPRKHDRPQRFFARNVLRLAGAGVRAQRAPGFDPKRTSIFISNHVNLFDPFVVYSAVPQFVRGWELESHFRIPVYGWIMKRFGNVPVADQGTPGRLKRLFELTKQALDSGTSLTVFPEGSRTRDGRVRPFHKGIFRIVRDLGVPIVPLSIVGSYEFNHKGSWMLRPSTIVVHLHDTIETQTLTDAEIEALPDRIYQIVSGPVHEAMRGSEAGKTHTVSG
ncbi:MAG: lysophospholipid acyltransferase family protein [Terriglobia bacterium]